VEAGGLVGDRLWRFLRYACQWAVTNSNKLGIQWDYELLPDRFSTLRVLLTAFPGFLLPVNHPSLSNEDGTLQVEEFSMSLVC